MPRTPLPKQKRTSCALQRSTHGKGAPGDQDPHAEDEPQYAARGHTTTAHGLHPQREPRTKRREMHAATDHQPTCCSVPPPPLSPPRFVSVRPYPSCSLCSSSCSEGRAFQSFHWKDAVWAVSDWRGTVFPVERRSALSAAHAERTLPDPVPRTHSGEEVRRTWKTGTAGAAPLCTDVLHCRHAERCMCTSVRTHVCCLPACAVSLYLGHLSAHRGPFTRRHPPREDLPDLRVREVCCAR